LARLSKEIYSDHKLQQLRLTSLQRPLRETKALQQLQKVFSVVLQIKHKHLLVIFLVALRMLHHSQHQQEVSLGKNRLTQLSQHPHLEVSLAVVPILHHKRLRLPQEASLVKSQLTRRNQQSQQNQLEDCLAKVQSQTLLQAEDYLERRHLPPAKEACSEDPQRLRQVTQQTRKMELKHPRDQPMPNH
jgi:hypothetical protein